MRGRWVVTGAGLALLVGVLVVRPGSQVPPEAVVLPRPAPSTAAAAPGAAVTGPDGLAGARLAELGVSAAGIGPLVLGRGRTDLADGGWGLLYGWGDCVRVAPTLLGEVVLSGWVVDDVLVTAQVEVAASRAPAVPTGAGFSFGAPVEAAEEFRQSLLVAGSGRPGGGTEVRVGSREDGAAVRPRLRPRVDVGRPVGGGPRVGCPGLRGGAGADRGGGAAHGPGGGPGVGAVPVAARGRAGGGQARAERGDGYRRRSAVVGRVPWGRRPARTRRRPAAATCCVRRPRPAATELFLRDGRVVGQRFTLEGYEPVTPAEAARDVGRFLPEAGVLVGRPEVSYGRAGPDQAPDARGVSGTYGYVAELLAPLDTGVLVEGPSVLEERVGDTCG